MWTVNKVECSNCRERRMPMARDDFAHMGVPLTALQERRPSCEMGKLFFSTLLIANNRRSIKFVDFILIKPFENWNMLIECLDSTTKDEGSVTMPTWRGKPRCILKSFSVPKGFSSVLSLTKAWTHCAEYYSPLSFKPMWILREIESTCFWFIFT